MRIYQCSKKSAEDFLLKNNLKTMLNSCPKNSMKKLSANIGNVTSNDSEDSSLSDSSPVLLKKRKDIDNNKLNKSSKSILSIKEASSKNDLSADVICI